ncbi:MAG: hypothetical protein ABIP93_11550 [Gemmatimonadaceae bacterium]
MERRRQHWWTVEGVEESTARVSEDGARSIVIPLYLLPPGVEEGEILSVTRSDERGGSVRLTIAADEAAAERALARARRAQERALEASKRADPGGDVRP